MGRWLLFIAKQSTTKKIVMTDKHCSTAFDADFNGIKGLMWLPWVGRRFSKLPQGVRLLIVGESCYDWTPEDEANDSLKNPKFTRLVVSEHAINREVSPSPTFDNLALLLFGTEQYKRERFWSDVAFYNLVQRPMYDRWERPSWEDFVSGWSTFTDVIRILKPSHALFIGVSAFYFFNYSMSEQNADFTEVQWAEQVGRTYGRKASISTGSETVALIGVQHTSQYFSWSSWRDYLGRRHRDLTAFIDAEGYTRERLAWTY